MFSLKIALTVSLAHLVYYFYFQVISDMIRKGMTRNTPNKTISRLRTQYHVNIRTFQKNSNHYGFAWFRTIYLNENLFKNEKALLFTFHHEYYHLKHKHKRNILLQRLVFSFIPMLLMVHWIAFSAVYVFCAYGMEQIRLNYEKDANNYANLNKNK